MKKILEIRAAEGGVDSKLFVNDLMIAYEKTFLKLGWKSKRLDQRSGFVSLEVNGSKLNKLVNESGGHRIQRIPPTEKRGRVHTSTVTVAVLDSTYTADPKYLLREPYHYNYEIFKSSGPGGQHRNKTSSGVKCIHLPTGLKQERTSKCQHANRRNALIAVNEMLDSIVSGESLSTLNDDRSTKVGSGMRGDKIRTYRFQDDRVLDHQSGISQSVKKVMRGNMMLFWN